MNKIQLIYFRGCPNYDVVKDLLCEMGLEYEEIDQNNLQENDLLKLLSSPSILKNGELIYGQRIGSAKGGCTLNLADKSYLAAKLKE